MRRLLWNVVAFAGVAAACGSASADPLKAVLMIPAVPQPWTAVLFGLGVGLIAWSEKLRRSARR